jgi:hypothetical protein
VRTARRNVRSFLSEEEALAVSTTRAPLALSAGCSSRCWSAIRMTGSFFSCSLATSCGGPKQKRRATPCAKGVLTRAASWQWAMKRASGRGCRAGECSETGFAGYHCAAFGGVRILKWICQSIPSEPPSLARPKRRATRRSGGGRIRARLTIHDEMPCRRRRSSLMRQQHGSRGRVFQDVAGYSANQHFTQAAVGVSAHDQ